MPVDFNILPNRNLIVFTYTGQISIQEALETVQTCARHSAYRPWMRQLCDLRLVTGVERDFPKLLKMQAKFAEEFRTNGDDLIVLFYAPTLAGQELAQMARRSWDGLNSVIVMIHDDEAEAMSMLGLKERSVSELRQLVA